VRPCDRRIVRPLRWALAAVVLAGAVRGAAAGASGEEHRWLSRVVLDEPRRCGGAEQWGRLDKRPEAAALARLACGRFDVLEDLVDVVYARRACSYLPTLAEADGGKELARWLLDHREVSRPLFRALQRAESPAKALRRFATLHAAETQAVLAYPDLAWRSRRSSRWSTTAARPSRPTCWRAFATTRIRAARFATT